MKCELLAFASSMARQTEGERDQELAQSLDEAEDRNLGGGDFGRPQDFGETGRDGDLLRAAGHVGDHAAANRAADLLAP